MLSKRQARHANVVWDPHQQNLIDNIEMVRRQATRWVIQDYRLYYQVASASDMMNDLQWSTLCECRKYSRVITVYNFLHQDPPDISLSHNTIFTSHHVSFHMTVSPSVTS